MTIKQRYNDPSIGQAFESIASLFAPMSGSDLAGYAAADANRQQAMQRAQQIALTDMFATGTGPLDDRIGIAAGLYTPNQSWGAVNMADATNRRGQDLTYSASIENNVRDNARALVIGRIVDATNRRGQDLDLQGVVYGHDKTYQSSTENNVRDNDRLRQTSAMDNLMTPLKPGEQTRAIDADMWTALGLGDMPATPEYSNDRVDGSDVKLTNVRLPDGTQTTAIETPQGLLDPQTNQPYPQGTTMFSTAAQGSAEDVGLGKTATGRVEQQMLEIGGAIGTAQSLRQMIADNGASQGMVGYIRGTGQNLIQSGTELGNLLGGTANEAAQAVQAGLIDGGLASEMFDPSLPAIDMLGNMLAFQYAKAMTGERLSNEMLRTARRSLGLDRPLSNQADSITRLDTAIQQLQQQQQFLNGALNTGQIGTMGNVTVPGAAPASPAASAPQGGTRLRYNPATRAFE